MVTARAAAKDKASKKSSEAMPYHLQVIMMNASIRAMLSFAYTPWPRNGAAISIAGVTVLLAGPCCHATMIDEYEMFEVKTSCCRRCNDYE